MHETARGDAVAAMEWLTAQGADINARNSDDETSTHDAAFGDALDAMNWLRSLGADVNARDEISFSFYIFLSVVYGN